MATDGYANRINGIEYNAVDERRMNSVLLMPGGPTSAPFSARSGRRVNGAGLTVSVGGSPEAWTCTPGPGEIYESGYASQGGWAFEIPNSVSANLPARPGAGQSRIDLIVARIYDTQAIGSGPAEVKIERINGAAGAPGVAPSPPAGSITLELARLGVPAVGAITVTQSTRRTVAAGGVLPVATTAEMDALKTDNIAYAGLVVNNAQTNSLHRYDGTLWRRLVDDAFDTPWTPIALGSGWSGFGNGFNDPAVRRVGDVVEMRGVMTGGDPGPAFFLYDTKFHSTAKKMLLVNAGAGAARAQMAPEASLFSIEAYIAGGSNSFVSLDEIRYQGV